MQQKIVTNKYCGIGSRSTPPEVLQLMQVIASDLSTKSWILRSGGASGADTAFEQGAMYKEVYLPWRGFNQNSSPLYPPSRLASRIATKYHPLWKRLSTPAQLLMARNTHQVLGQNCDDPVEFILCWTPDGAETKTSRKTGGTGLAIRIAIDMNIPVFNLKTPNAYERLVEFLDTFS